MSSYRTSEINPLFDVMCDFSDDYKKGKEKRTDDFHHQSATAPRQAMNVLIFSRLHTLEYRRKCSESQSVANTNDRLCLLRF